MSVTAHVEGGLAPMAAAGVAHARVRLIGDLEGIEEIRSAWAKAPVGRFDAELDFFLAFAASVEGSDAMSAGASCARTCWSRSATAPSSRC